MKIDVITLHNVNNYGSALQTYATQTVFEKMGYQVEFIDYYRDGSSIKKRVDINLKFSNIYNKNTLLKMIGKTILTYSFKKQDKVFKKFLNKNIHLTRKYESYNELLSDVPQADIYCTGSDQVWNSEWNSKIDNTFFLDFINSKAKKIAVAASFGKTEISKEEANIIKPMLKKYSGITVREQSARLILKEMGIESEVILDPTLLLTKDEWHKFCQDNGKIVSNYIFVYQLNSKFPEFDEYVKRLSKKWKLPIIRLSVFPHQKFKYGKLDFCPEIEKFVEYIKNAQFVVTDSFHCTAFAINLNKKFAAIYPPKFPTRLENILKKTNLISRKVTDFNDINSINNEIDYVSVNTILDIERTRSLNLIRKMIGDIND